MYLLSRWFLRLPMLHRDQQGAALQALVLGLTLIVLFQAMLLVLLSPR